MDALVKENAKYHLDAPYKNKLSVTCMDALVQDHA